MDSFSSSESFDSISGIIGSLPCSFLNALLDILFICLHCTDNNQSNHVFCMFSKKKLSALSKQEVVFQKLRDSSEMITGRFGPESFRH